MSTPEVSRTSAPALRNSSAQYLTAFAVWLPVGFIGATGLVVGVVQFFGGAPQPLAALAFAVAYGLLAAFSWRRARAALAAPDNAIADVENRAQADRFYRADLGMYVTASD